MTKMTRAAAKRRLNEAASKFKKVYMSQHGAVKTADMEGVEKIVTRCLKRLG
jgi:hypothetical protein